MTGVANFNETFFTDVRVPKDQIVVLEYRVGKSPTQFWDTNEKLFATEHDVVQAECGQGHDETRNRFERLIDNPAYRDLLMKLKVVRCI